MATPILTTKLYIPPPPPKVVQRLRLIERLNEDLHRKLTLISAPAGFGKTTLVSAWLAGNARRVAWLSLDKGDNDPIRFLTYFVVALQSIVANFGEGVLGVLQSPQPPAYETILTALLNEITTTLEVPGNFVLVLDDYHVIDARAVDDALTFLLEHLPGQMHLVITTREDPQLPLARLRARGQLTELRAADLRFTPPEAAGFLNEAMGLNLSSEDVSALETRTEGWIAGLQMAAISMQGRQDVSAFIRSFAGDHRYIADYLVEEVLQSQPESVRSFLLQTSILDRLTGSLCDAVTGQQEGHMRLAALEKGNFFVIPLDDRRYWYRYHHLFAEVLSAHLMEEQRDLVPTLHRRASEWYEHNDTAEGAMPQAIRHALAAEDFERAADLVERAVPAMRPSRQEATLFGWLKALPDELIQYRPVLSAMYAHVLLGIGELDGVEDRLRDAERWLDSSVDTAGMHAPPDVPPSGMVVVDGEAFRRLPAEIAAARAGLALVRGNVTDAVKYARRVRDLVPEDDHLGAGSGAALLGLASWASGDLEAAHRTFAEGMAHLQMAGYLSDAIGGSVALADILIAQGQLREAMRTYERGLHLATAGISDERGALWAANSRPSQPDGVPGAAQGSRNEAAGRDGREQAKQGTPVLRGAADMYVGMSALYREHNDLDAATQHLLRGKELGEHTGFPQNHYRWRVAMSRIREAGGDLDGALDLLGEAERLYASDFFPNVRPVAALRARVWIAQGRLGEALDWTREQGLSTEDDLSYLREFEHITLARLLLARYRSKGEGADRSILDAMGLLERLLQAAEEGGRTGSAIEILVLQALAHQIQGDISADLRPSSFVPLQRALTLAEPEGYVRVFVDEGMPMARLLREAAARGIMPDYTGRLVQSFEVQQQQGSPMSGVPSGPRTLVLRSLTWPQGQEPAGRSAGESPLHTLPTLPTSRMSGTSQSLAEPLSQRELEVLRLFQTELTGPQIAGELVIALSTLRTHTKGIYSKLNVNSRRAAVKRAADLDLI